MNETTIKYLSGLIDSDGNVGFRFRQTVQNRDKSRYYLELAVNIASSDAVDRHGFMGSLPSLTGFGRVSRSGDKNQYLYWTISSKRDLEMMVPRLLKHMVVKARHLERMFQTWKDTRGVTLSKEECDELKDFSKKSRLDSGPLKPKNHPSWCWVAGYLDGNGCFSMRRGKNYTQVRVRASCHTNDAAVLEFLKKAFGGGIGVDSKSGNCSTWTRNLGVSDRSFALQFLGKLVRHSRFKRHKIEQTIAFHHGHLQRLSVPAPKGDAIV